MKRYIFVDFDGVLAGEEEWKSLLLDGNCPFNKQALDNLEYVIESFDEPVDIIVSSSWRHGMSVEDLQDLFKERGFKYYQNVIDKTRSLQFQKDNEVNIQWYMSVPRGCEIEEWIESHIDRFVDQFKYVILDDGSDMLYWQRNNFILTKQDDLFTKENAQQAVEILR